MSIATSKNSLSARTKFIIGILAFAGIPYEMCSKQYPVSKSYYYELKGPAEKLLDKLFGQRDDVKGILLITPGFIERCVMALSFYCRSPIEGIVSFFDLVIGHHVSKGTIHRIREAAREKAEVYDAQISLEHVSYVAMDEIFQQETPILTAVDLETRYILMMEPAENRTGETWKQALSEKKEQGLQPRLCISDGGSGLLKGVPQAFPEIDMQLDVFHSLRALGIEVQKKQRNAIAQLSELYSLETRMNGQRIHKKTREKYQAVTENIDECLRKADTLDILYTWLREYVGFSGYGYEKSMDLCNWILDEMAGLYPEHKKYLSAIETFRKRLPNLLFFLQRLFTEMALVAPMFDTDAHSFMLLYNQSAYPSYSLEYEAIEHKLYHIFRNELPRAREVLSDILQKSYRASSLIENVNGCLRPFIDLKREIPVNCFILLKVFFNTKVCIRSRKEQWRNTSAAERLTGSFQPEFLDIVSAPLDYVA